MFLAQQESSRVLQFSLAPLTEEHGIALAAMGILVVFTALVLVAVFITLLPRMIGAGRQKKAEEAAKVPTGLAVDGELPEQILVVIAAAVAEALDHRPHSVVRVRGMTPSELGWSLDGRMQQHHSHQIRGRK